MNPIIVWLKLAIGLVIGVLLFSRLYAFGDKALSPRSYRHALLYFIGANIAGFIAMAVTAIADGRDGPRWLIVIAATVMLGALTFHAIRGALLVRKERTG